MCRPEYDLTYDDLNPTFLFSCELSARSLKTITTVMNTSNCRL